MSTSHCSGQQLILRSVWQRAESYLHDLHKTLGRWVTLPEAPSGRTKISRGASNSSYSEIFPSYGQLWVSEQ
jgi:hypothetical protein